ncbi:MULTISPECIES: hypothetical protein [unclassified Streptomyces]|uniref:hypothetical protein n=1 Tax=unclassified Streptomyces TaxID=2593676 RepID=UPI00332D78D7
MSEQLTFFRGERLLGAMAVRYLPDGDTCSSEGVELLFDSGRSTLLWCGTDWTLRISEGEWPKLPEWCWPLEDWAFEKVSGPGDAGFDRIDEVSGLYNSVGDLDGALLEFPAGSMVIKSGEAVTWEIIRKADADSA